MSLVHDRMGRNWFPRFLALALGAGTLIFLLSALTANAKSTRTLVKGIATAATPCTMVGSGVFISGGNQIHKEDSLNTDTTQPERLVLRSLSGPSKFFRLTTVTSASCRNNPAYPPEETGTPVNFFDATGMGSFGTSAGSISPGYTFRVEVGDLGDSASGDNATADVFAFTIRDSLGNIVWEAKDSHLISGSEEISQGTGPPPPPPGSCEPSSSLSVLVSGTNVVSYVPKGSWAGGTTDISAVNVEGASITPTRIATPNVVNSAASNPLTGKSVATANNTDVYVLNGTTLTNTLTSGGSGTISFSGGDATNTGVAMDATHNRAVLGLSVGGAPGFQFLDLTSNTFGSPFTSPSGEISEDPLIDPGRNLLLSASEDGNFQIVNVANPASPTFFENATGGGVLDSSGEDCSTGIALAGAEGSDPSSVFIADLSQATFTPGSPDGTWSAPSQNQTLSESSLSAGASGVAVAQGTHTGVLSGEFGGNAITALALPTTSGSGTPAISDWVTCNIDNTPDGNPWSHGLDPHTVTAYQTPSGGDAIGLFANDSANWLARVDLTKLLNPSIVPRDTAGHACASGTIPSSAESFTSVP